MPQVAIIDNPSPALIMAWKMRLLPPRVQQHLRVCNRNGIIECVLCQLIEEHLCGARDRKGGSDEPEA